jgi:hypothetical protein
MSMNMFRSRRTIAAMLTVSFSQRCISTAARLHPSAYHPCVSFTARCFAPLPTRARTLDTSCPDT